jgi:hypothetical protein
MHGINSTNSSKGCSMSQGERQSFGAVHCRGQQQRNMPCLRGTHNYSKFTLP